MEVFLVSMLDKRESGVYHEERFILLTLCRQQSGNNKGLNQFLESTRGEGRELCQIFKLGEIVVMGEKGKR